MATLAAHQVLGGGIPALGHDHRRWRRRRSDVGCVPARNELHTGNRGWPRVRGRLTDTWGMGGHHRTRIYYRLLVMRRFHVIRIRLNFHSESHPRSAFRPTASLDVRRAAVYGDWATASHGEVGTRGLSAGGPARNNACARTAVTGRREPGVACGEERRVPTAVQTAHSVIDPSADPGLGGRDGDVRRNLEGVHVLIRRIRWALEARPASGWRTARSTAPVTASVRSSGAC